MYKKTKIFLIFSLLLSISCNLRETNFSDNEILVMKHNVMKNCDVKSYGEYYTYLGKKDSLLYMEVLPYALKMMEVKNSGSQYDFFVNFLKIRFKGKFKPDDLNKLVVQEQNLLIYYLEGGTKDGSSYCANVISDYYRKGIYYKKDVKKADSIYKATYGQPYPNKTE
jgi:hypothetical protein